MDRGGNQTCRVDFGFERIWLGQTLWKKFDGAGSDQSQIIYILCFYRSLIDLIELYIIWSRDVSVWLS
jgi:hypothetical protein